MNGAVFFAIAPIFFCLIGLAKPVQGGNCWMVTNKDGLCTEILAKNISKEECCDQFPYVSTAWSEKEMNSGRLFFERLFGNGVPCFPCKKSCAKVDCGPEKKCVLRSGRPYCVCSPCDERGRKSNGLVCGSDGNTYRNACQLKKRACQRGKSDLRVDYNGYCQSNCDQVKCQRGKYCVLDQNLSPHCVRCAIRCTKTPENMRPVCGANGVTYADVCVLRQKACTGGKAIPTAYKGRCKANATCENVRCRDHESCLIDTSSGLPRCVTCNSAKCRGGITREVRRSLCGTNNKTYHSWCQMVKDACATGFVIETKFQGPCDEGDKISSELIPMTTTSG